MVDTLTDSQLEGLCAYLNVTINDKDSTLGPAATADYLKWHATINSAPLMGMPIGTAEFAESFFGRIPRKLLNDLANQAGLTRLEAGGLSLAELIVTAESKTRAKTKPETDVDEIDLSAYVPMVDVWPDKFKKAGQCSRFLDEMNEIRQHKPSKNRRLVHLTDWHNYWKQQDEQVFDSLGDGIGSGLMSSKPRSGRRKRHTSGESS